VCVVELPIQIRATWKEFLRSCTRSNETVLRSFPYFSTPELTRFVRAVERRQRNMLESSDTKVLLS
jgi:hypothetical protein